MGMTREAYTKPNMEMVEFEVEDIVTTSGEGKESQGGGSGKGRVCNFDICIDNPGHWWNECVIDRLIFCNPVDDKA